MILSDSPEAERGEPLRDEDEMMMLICENVAGSASLETVGAKTSVGCDSPTKQGVTAMLGTKSSGGSDKILMKLGDTGERQGTLSSRVAAIEGPIAKLVRPLKCRRAWISVGS